MIVRNLERAEAFTTKDGSRIRSLLDLATAPVRNQSLAEASVDPGLRTARHRHAKSEEFYYVLEGRGLMELDGNTRELGPGDAVLIPPGSVHCVANQGRAVLRLLCCCAPAYSHEDTQLLEEPDGD